MKVKLKNEKKSVCGEGGSAVDGTHGGTQSPWKQHKSADHIVKPYKHTRVVDSHLWTYRNGISVLLLPEISTLT